MFRGLLVPEGFGQVLVPGNAAPILRRTGTTSFDGDRSVFDRRLSLGKWAKGKEVAPRVAKIVLVHPSRNLPLGDLLDRNRVLVGHWGIIFEFVQVESGVGEDAVAEAELVQVTVAPAHGDLDDGVKSAEVC